MHTQRSFSLPKVFLSEMPFCIHVQAVPVNQQRQYYLLSYSKEITIPAVFDITEHWDAPYQLSWFHGLLGKHMQANFSGSACKHIPRGWVQ